ncbi:hypothetical protein BST13_32470 [Mycobacterium aquaticum]|uniref:Uncharacterized protein n=1 Tax=Mycobacterium aquaticum TaxID=1927124 RepID=A0A1X0A805_9MYCO|nr:hypothetical protein BST13_32470 [Mycobacterium aquaticum]
MLLFATSACGIDETPAPNTGRDNSALSEKVGTGHRSDGIAGEWIRVHTEQAELVTAKAKWHHPDVLSAGTTDVIGLTIGDTPELSSSINALLPQTITSPAGTVRVGPTTTAELSASPEDAIVTPSQARNASTDRDIALLWSWDVTPKRPLDELVLMAHISVPIDGGASVNTDIPLRIHVKRTFSFTVHQVFGSWTTWSAIAAAIAARAAWLHRKLKKARHSTGTPEASEAATEKVNDGDQKEGVAATAPAVPSEPAPSESG